MSIDTALNDKDAEISKLREALEFYANPETYFAIAMFGDAPCGEFLQDFELLDGDLGHPDDGGAWYKPGKRARQALGWKYEAIDNDTLAE